MACLHLAGGRALRSRGIEFAFGAVNAITDTTSGQVRALHPIANCWCMQLSSSDSDDD